MKNNDRKYGAIVIILMLTAIFSFYQADDLIENGGGKSFGVPHDFLDMTLINHLFTEVTILAVVGIYTLIVLLIETFSKRHHSWLYILEGTILISCSILQIWLGLRFTLSNLTFILLGITFISYSFFGKLN